MQHAPRRSTRLRTVMRIIIIRACFQSILEDPVRCFRTILLACVAATPALALAGPADYVYTPAIEYGERELDFKIGTAKSSGEQRFSAASLGLGFGLTERWFTEFYTKFERGGGEGTRFDA